jgi:uncharacterized protein YpmS
MNKTTTTNDPQKKYWWLILIALPIILAIIAIVPALLHKEPQATDKATPTIHIEQKAEGVEQKNERGNNNNNVIGDINLATPVKK